MAELKASDVALLVKAGRLKFKLHAGQRELHDHYRAWEKKSCEARKRGEKLPGRYPRIYVADCSRRFGKDFWGITQRIEDAIQRPNSMLTYATAYQKDIAEIVIPLFEQITQDFPPGLKPVYKQSFQGQVAGFYFPNKSLIKLVGIDRNPDSLRGKYSDGITISEAGFVENLEYAIKSVLMPQLQGRLHATIVLNSTPPKDPGHFFDDIACVDALDRGAYFTRTIMDNPLLSESERQEFIDAAGGLDSEDCQREYFCKRIRSETRVVIPEFDLDKHVAESPTPEYALGYTVIDPGVRDICAVQCLYYDFERAKLVVRRDWGKTGANTQTVVNAIREMEAQTFYKLPYWNGSKVLQNPIQRYSDTEARLILDLNSQHHLKIGAANKDGAEAALHALRNAFQTGKIEIHPDAKQTIQHLTNAVWNKGRTSYERSELFGHFDQVDVLKYAWRHVNRTQNPNPPAGWKLKYGDGRFSVNSDDIWVRPDLLKTSNRIAAKLQNVLPKGLRTRRFSSR